MNRKTAKSRVAALVAAWGMFALPQSAMAQTADELVALIERAEAAMLDGRNDASLALAERAAARCMEPGIDVRTCIYLLDTAGAAARDRLRFDLAVRWSERSLALSRESLEPTHPATVVGLTVYAGALRGAYRFADAAAAYREALVATDPASRTTSRLRSDFADLLRESGEYDEAEALARLAVEQAEAQEPGTMHLGRTLDVLGRVLFRQERFADAEPVFRRAIALLGDEGPASDQGLNWQTAASNLALTLSELGRLDEAEALQRETLEEHRLWGEDDPDFLAASANLARTLAERGNYDEARDLLRPALATARERMGADSLDAAAMAFNLAVVEDEAGRPERAEPLLEDAVRIRRLQLGDHHPMTIDALETLGRLRAKRDPAAALEAFRPAVAAVAANAASSAFDTRSALALHARRRLFFAQIDALFALGGQAHLEEAFEAAQWAMTSESAAAISRVAARRAGGSDAIAALEQRRTALVADRTVAEGAYYGLVGATEPGPVADRQRLGELLAALDPQIRAVEGEIAALDPAYFELSRPAVLSATAARDLLQPGEALLLLLPTADAAYVFALTRDGLAWDRAASLPAARLLELINQVRQSAQDDVAFEPPAFDRAAAFELHQALVAPVAELLAGQTRLIVVADWALAALPPALLVTQAPAGDDGDPRALQATAWLSDRYALSTLPAVGSLHALRCLLAERRADGCAATPSAAPPHRAEHLLQFAGVGAPTLEGRPEEPERGASRSAPPYARAFAGGLADSDFLRRLSPLPGAARELELMRATFTSSASLLVGDAARETAVKTDPGIAGARFLVFSTHGLLARQSGAVGEPGLVFTPPDAGGRSALDDGLLTASEAAQLSLAAELVVLSACNTGTPEGDGIAGGLSGLSRAFFVAGAKTLVVSHWAVSDLGTAALMAAFFRQIEANPDTPRAVLFGRAMAQVRQIPRLASPGFWSAFTLVGTGD